MKDPTYRNMGDHTECIQIQYDPSVVTYEKLLEIMFNDHYSYLRRPGSLQYRSGIWYQDENQKEIAEKVIEQIRQQTGREVYTHLAPLGEFYMAEEYHQKYVEKSEASNKNSIFGKLFSGGK
mmetsp:Transcript_11468/g.22007  ORF Transcript_11468/g.22007 Transcript_11468/m.22007 type:complete len:122 (-) Transcript_11468:205-570(-)